MTDPIVIDPAIGVPKHAFEGYSFYRDDIIIGSSGYTDFRKTTGQIIEPHEDGAYIVINRVGSRTIVGTDFSGRCKLFVYRWGEYWGISNSFMAIAEWAKKKGLPLTINCSQLCSFCVDGTFGSQLASLQTSFEQIRLVPSCAHLEVKHDDKGSLQLSEKTQSDRLDLGDYTESLGRFIHRWRNRLAGLLISNLSVVCDISGGRDSRATFALLVATARAIGDQYLDAVSLNSKWSARRDFQVASNACAHIGITLKKPRVDIFGRNHLSTDQSFNAWKTLTLGTYRLLYPLMHRRESNRIWISGSGGESHRYFYRHRGSAAFLNQKKRFFPSKDKFERFREEVEQDLHSLAEEGIDPTITHYRQFRDRFHGGRRSLFLNDVSPLTGKLLYSASNSAGEKRLESGQVIADIIRNTTPSLLDVPFEDASIPYGDAALSGCVNVSKFAGDEVTPGRVFGSNETAQLTGAFSEPIFIELLHVEFSKMLVPAAQLGIFSDDCLESARETMTDAYLSGRIGHATSMGNVAHIIHAGRLVELA